MSGKLKIQQQQEIGMKFKVGDRARCLKGYPGQFTKHCEYLVTNVSPDGRRLWFAMDDEGSTTNGWQSEHFARVERSQPCFMYGNLQTPVDPDLKRPGYHEECSEYRACQNEVGDWVVEAKRTKVIAQAADEQEAHRIATALNITTVTN